MKTNTELLKIASKYLKQGGSKFRSYCGLPGNAAWCCAFVTYIFHECGVSDLFYGGKKVVYCPNAIKWCDTHLAKVPLYLALPSDIIFFDWNRNGVPDHIGFVRERKSATEIYTIEGNTDGGRVAYKTRAAKYVQGVYRPHFKGSFNANKQLKVDGMCGYNTIAVLQKWLGVTIDGILGKDTVKALQRKVGVTADGAWGTKTSKAVQKLVGTKVDGNFGPNSVKALQKFLNKRVNVVAKPATPKPAPQVNANKIAAKAKELAWAKGTAKSKYAWSGGTATAAFKTAINKVYPKRSNWSKAPRLGCCCDVFVGTVVRSSGVDPTFPRGFDEQIKHKSDKLQKLVFTNVAPLSVAKDGDVILYTKNKKGTEKHVLIYADGVIYEAQYEKTYGHVNTGVEKKLNVKRPKVVIFRIK